MKNKTISTIILGIFLLSLASAIYAGECEELDVSSFNSLDNIVYSVVGNSSNLEGLNISIVNSNIEICPVVNYKPDNFTLIFMDNSTYEKQVVVYRSSGRKTKTVYENVTEFIEVHKVEYIEYINNLTEEDICLQDPRCIKYTDPIEEESPGFFNRFWNLIKRWMSRLNL